MQSSDLNKKDKEQAVYLFPVDFFKSPNFIERYNKELRRFRRLFLTEKKEKVQGALNAFYFACLNSKIEEKDKLEVHLGFFETLNFYAQQYSSKQTFLNVIAEFEKPNLKSKLFSKHTVRSSIIYAETLIMYYNLIKLENPTNSFEISENLIKAKSYLWKVYIQHLEGKNILNETDLSSCLTLLSLSLTELSRWFEPLYYLNIAKKYLHINANVDYTRALLLEAIKQKTCLSYNGLLLLKIIDYCLEAKKSGNILVEQKQQLIRVETQSRKFIKDQKLSIKNLRKHYTKIVKQKDNFNSYNQFCIENQLYLNEHSFFCQCPSAIRDDLQIETNHPHTQINWVQQFESILEVSIYDFILARHNYYKSLDKVNIHGFHVNSIKRGATKKNIKNALLKNSFKTLYSILDQLAHGIFQVMEIDYQKKLKNKFPNKNERPKIYFLNMWDQGLGLFEDKDFESNYYLISLYSIARDLSKDKYAALSSFRSIRNAMEHKILHVVGSDTELKHYKSMNEEAFTKLELIEKTKILMILTKSAIFSFVYLIRHQSKFKENTEHSKIRWSY
ncbi:hypothetical protein MATR_26830 [Marivirga tractuosa]|uniref:LA2681-like HEPN domain-containing protein n=1 Tax=Marivirga tractuosa (strain ATCC 23168 / DSM 4126 / NBRC 15989 / NCIMB 1408 / VKM B-1430 / H-43) TaxID=643867 RepID=E4TN77_MARTH|nr:LA2681 family HEPN domain-containing protein [Marivirga tractuosa]ADR23465.1 hypothetical protein Ftrac_3493 [Marivirga tractuosa DSM 4126]BDD15858.1 hypothetical protein MATR_26830 [Marivirga tractuosa]